MHLNGDAGIEHIHNAPSDTRINYYQAVENGSPIGSPVAHIPPYPSSSKTLYDIDSDKKNKSQEPKHVVCALFRDNDFKPTEKDVGFSTASNKSPGSQLNHSGKMLNIKNELIMNEFVHRQHYAWHMICRPNGTSLIQYEREKIITVELLLDHVCHQTDLMNNGINVIEANGRIGHEADLIVNLEILGLVVLHRRLLFDDGKGVAKALNETNYVGDDFRGLAGPISLRIRNRSQDTMSHTRTSTECSSLQRWSCVESKYSLESTITYSLVPGVQAGHKIYVVHGSSLPLIKVIVDNNPQLATFSKLLIINQKLKME
nr:T-complex protein 11 [Tanacetum cinerariifolium]